MSLYPNLRPRQPAKRAPSILSPNDALLMAAVGGLRNISRLPENIFTAFGMYLGHTREESQAAVAKVIALHHADPLDDLDIMVTIFEEMTEALEGSCC